MKVLHAPLLFCLSIGLQSASIYAKSVPYTYADISFNERTFAQAYAAIEKTDAHYIPLRDMFICHLGDAGSYAPSTYTLALLDEIVARHVNANSFAEYQRNLQATIQELQQARVSIERRMGDLRYITIGIQSSANEYVIQLHDCCAIEKALIKRIKKMTAFSKFLDFHHPYFKLVDVYSSSWHAYCECLSYVRQASVNDYSYELLMAHINAQSMGNAYPLKTFHDATEKVIKDLEAILGQTKVSYHPLQEYVQAFLKDLRLLAHFIKNNTQYSLEVRQLTIAALTTKHDQLYNDTVCWRALQKTNEANAATKALEVQQRIQAKIQEMKQLEQERELLLQQAPFLQ